MEQWQQELVLKRMNFAKKWALGYAKTFKLSHLDRKELIAEAILGLNEAASKTTLERLPEFPGYTLTYIRGYILNWLTKHGYRQGNGFKPVGCQSLRQNLHCSDPECETHQSLLVQSTWEGADPSRDLPTRVEQQDLVTYLLHVLTPKEQKAILLYFIEGLTMRMTGKEKEFNVSPGRIGNIIGKSIFKMRQEMNRLQARERFWENHEETENSLRELIDQRRLKEAINDQEKEQKAHYLATLLSYLPAAELKVFFRRVIQEETLRNIKNSPDPELISPEKVSLTLGRIRKLEWLAWDKLEKIDPDFTHSFRFQTEPLERRQIAERAFYLLWKEGVSAPAGLQLNQAL